MSNNGQRYVCIARVCKLRLHVIRNALSWPDMHKSQAYFLAARLVGWPLPYITPLVRGLFGKQLYCCFWRRHLFFWMNKKKVEWYIAWWHSIHQYFRKALTIYHALKPDLFIFYFLNKQNLIYWLPWKYASEYPFFSHCLGILIVNWINVNPSKLFLFNDEKHSRLSHALTFILQWHHPKSIISSSNCLTRR